jgi:hypothetical protein
MKSQAKIQLISLGFIITLIGFLFSGCNTNRIVVQNDIVYSTKRIELEYLCGDKDRRSPLSYLKQFIVKEIKNNNEAVIKVYDILTLTSSGFKLEDKVFMIVDNNN